MDTKTYEKALDICRTYLITKFKNKMVYNGTTIEAEDVLNDAFIRLTEDGKEFTIENIKKIIDGIISKDTLDSFLTKPHQIQAYKDRLKDYYFKNKEKIDARSKEWAKNNPEKAKAKYMRWIKKYPNYHRLYNLLHKEDKAKWRVENKEHIKEYCAQNSDKFTQRATEWNKANKDKYREYQKEYHRKRREQKKIGDAI